MSTPGPGCQGKGHRMRGKGARVHGQGGDAVGKARLTASIVLLLRVPGQLTSVGVDLKVCEPKKKSYLAQQDLERKEFSLPSN